MRLFYLLPLFHRSLSDHILEYLIDHQRPRSRASASSLCAPGIPANGAAARDADSGTTRLVLVAPSLPDAEAVALATGATGILDAASVVASLGRRSRLGLAIGLSARPREYADAVPRGGR
jgi:hypothetical protein